MNRGFLIVVNNSDLYKNLGDVLIDSIIAFTDLPIEYVTINFDRTFNNSRINSRRINLKNECNENIYYTKIQAAKTSNLDEGFLIDVDAVVTPKITEVFDNASKINDSILCPLHPQDPHNQLALMNILGIPEKTQPYVHASCFLFSKKSKEFYKKFFEMYNTVKSLNLNDRAYYANYDETFINLIFWKEKRTDTFLACCDPFFEYAFSNEEYTKNYPGKIGNVEFKIKEYVWHGCKDVDRAKQLLERIKKKYES